MSLYEEFRPELDGCFMNAKGTKSEGVPANL